MTENAPGGGKTTITKAGIPELDSLLEKIERMLHLERVKQIDEWAALWADNAKVRFPIEAEPGRRNIDGKQAIVSWTAAKFVERASTDIDVLLEAVAGSRRVIAHMNVLLHFANGLSIGGPLVCIYTFNENGLIELMEEYVNDVIFPPHYKDLATEDKTRAAK